VADFQWVTDIVIALRSVGGQAPLSSLYRKIQGHRNKLPENWKSCIRATLQNHCKESKQYREPGPDLFRAPERGVWSLRKIAEPETVKLNKDDLWVLVFQRMSATDLADLSKNRDPLELLNQKVADINRELLMERAP
jgi:hypothetical protein